MAHISGPVCFSIQMFLPPFSPPPESVFGTKPLPCRQLGSLAGTDLIWYN